MSEITPFALVDVDCNLDPSLKAAWAEAVSIQLQRDFAGSRWGYNRSGILTVRASAADALPGENLILLMKTPDQPDALGYHDPSRITKVFPFLCPSLDQVPVTISHECVEFDSDTDCATLVLGLDGKIRLCEAGDPTEEDFYEIAVQSGSTVKVSNFVGKDYFDGGQPGKAPSFDLMGLIRTAGEIRPGGYQTFWTAETGFSQVSASRKSAYRNALDFLARAGHHKTRHDKAMAKPHLKIVDRSGTTITVDNEAAE